MKSPCWMLLLCQQSVLGWSDWSVDRRQEAGQDEPITQSCECQPAPTFTDRQTLLSTLQVDSTVNTTGSWSRWTNNSVLWTPAGTFTHTQTDSTINTTGSRSTWSNNSVLWTPAGTYIHRQTDSTINTTGRLHCQHYR